MSSALTPPSAGCIAVGALNQARRHGRRYQAILTLQDPRCRWGHRLTFHAGDAHLDRLTISCEDFDLDDRDVAVATEADVDAILAFGRKHAGDALLIHCMHGVGRSAAAALAILADRLGAGREKDAVAKLFAMRPEATPNLVITALADRALDRNGALTSALAQYEAAAPSFAAKRRMRLELFEKNPELFARR